MAGVSVFGQGHLPRRDDLSWAPDDARPTAPAPRPRSQERQCDARERVSRMARLLSRHALLR